MLGMVQVVKEWPELTEAKRNEEHKRAYIKMYSLPRVEELGIDRNRSLRKENKEM